MCYYFIVLYIYKKEGVIILVIFFFILKLICRKNIFPMLEKIILVFFS